MHIGKRTQYKAVLSLMAVIILSSLLLAFMLFHIYTGGNLTIIVTALICFLMVALLISLLFYKIYSRPLIKFWIKGERRVKMQTRKQFADFMDDLPLGVFIKDEQSRSLYLNKHMDNVFGKSNCIGKTPYNIFNKEIADRVIKEDRRVLLGENVMVEEALTDKNGKPRVYMTHKFLMQEDDSDPMIGGISIEITRRREAEYKLRILGNAIRNSPVCVIITDPDGYIEFVNPAFVNSTGYSFAEVMGKNTNIINSGKHDRSFFSDMWATISKGEDWHGEILNRKKDGTLFWELVNISPVKNKDGEITHFVAIKDNISKRKQMEADLLEAKEEAEESDRLKSAFLANMSHEIRTPMNAIVGLSSLLSDPDLPLSERNGFCSVIQENSNVLLQLIDDIVDISKMEAGQIVIRPALCEINSLLSDIYESFILQVKDKNLQFSLNTENPWEELYTVTDSHRLRQVMANLISNALKFTGSGKVEFGCMKDKKGHIVFYVKDTGIGIPREKHQLIFDRFRQADDSRTRNHKGAGLGLSISKSLVEILGGTIWVKSETGKGSEFYFTIPLKDSETDEPLIKKSGIFPLPDLTGKCILVVEDIEVNYKLIKEFLRKTDAEILWAKTGRQAIDFCRSNSELSLVLLDLNLPDIYGADLLPEIKKLRGDLPVIIQTAYAMDGEREICYHAGCKGFITKPIKKDQLIQVMNGCIFQNNPD